MNPLLLSQHWGAGAVFCRVGGSEIAPERRLPHCPDTSLDWQTGLVEEFELDYPGVESGGAPWKIDDGARIARYGEATPETFAGQWIENGTERVVAFTESIDEHLAALRELVYAPDRIRAVQFRYSYRHLLDLTHRIASILGTNEGLTGWGPDVIHNRVNVRVLPERIDEVHRSFMETNPDDVLVEPGTPKNLAFRRRSRT